MKPSFRPRRARPLPGLNARLLDELKRGGNTARGDAATPVSGDAIALYRDAIEQLEAQVARGDGHPPMRQREVDLMCRCALSSHTLAEAIQNAADFCEMLHPRAGALTLTVRGTRAFFEMDSLRRTRSSAACLVDLTGLLCYLQLFGWLIGQPLQPEAVWLGHPHRDDAVPLLGVFNAPATVGASAYGFAFDATLLSRRVVRQLAELDGFLVDFPFRLIDAPPRVVSWAQQVRGILDAALIREHALPGLPELAAGFGISEPTLRRRLAADGAGYQVLRERCLRDAAERCLRDTDWSMTRIAAHLGLGSEEAFRRAFRRWTGHAPSHYRRDTLRPRSA